MNDQFQPSFSNLQKDIERYLTSIGNREMRSDGMIVYRGYDDALEIMFECYLKNGALEPLAKHFRSWNWEHSYNDFLNRLTLALKSAQDWSNLVLLWGKGVIQKRRKLYNDMWKIEKDDPGCLKQESIVESKKLLLQALGDFRAIAEALGRGTDFEKYSAMERKAREGKRA